MCLSCILHSSFYNTWARSRTNWCNNKHRCQETSHMANPDAEDPSCQAQTAIGNQRNPFSTAKIWTESVLSWFWKPLDQTPGSFDWEMVAESSQRGNNICSCLPSHGWLASCQSFSSQQLNLFSKQEIILKKCLSWPLDQRFKLHMGSNDLQIESCLNHARLTPLLYCVRSHEQLQPLWVTWFTSRWTKGNCFMRIQFDLIIKMSFPKIVCWKDRFCCCYCFF